MRIDADLVAACQRRIKVFTPVKYEMSFLAAAAAAAASVRIIRGARTALIDNYKCLMSVPPANCRRQWCAEAGNCRPLQAAIPLPL